MKGKNEFLLPNDINSQIPHGIYTLTKQESHDYTYRISHPLAQYVIHEAINAQTPVAQVEFDYTDSKKIVSVIKEQVGTLGYLKFRLLRYHSLKEEEERILVVSTDDKSNVFDDNFTQRLLLLPAVVTGDKVRNEELNTISSVLDKRQEDLTEALETVMVI